MPADLYTLNKGMRCIKYMLIGTNILFLIAALLLMSLGIMVQMVYTHFSDFLSSNFLTIPDFVVAIGIMMLLISIFGIISALKESTLLTNIFGVLLLIGLVLEISAAIAASVLPSQTISMLSKPLWDAFKDYDQDPGAKKAMDFVQTAASCCGVNGIHDWYDEGRDVPDSCCWYFKYDPIVDRDICASEKTEGCLKSLTFYINESATSIITGASTIAVVQFFVVIFAFVLARAIRRTKTLRAVANNGIQPNNSN